MVAAGERCEAGRPRRLDRGVSFADALDLEDRDGLRFPRALSRADSGQY